MSVDSKSNSSVSPLRCDGSEGSEYSSKVSTGLGADWDQGKSLSKQGISRGFGKGKPYGVFGDLENAVNSIVPSPNMWNIVLVVTEPLLEVRSEPADDSGIRNLLVDLRAKCLSWPGDVWLPGSAYFRS